MLKPFLDRARTGGILVVPEIKPILEAALGRSMALSSVYTTCCIGWMAQTHPDKQHPQSDDQAQQDWKKTPRNTSAARPRLGPRRADHPDVPGRGGVRTHQRRAPMLGARARRRTWCILLPVCAAEQCSAQKRPGGLQWGMQREGMRRQAASNRAASGPVCPPAWRSPTAWQVLTCPLPAPDQTTHVIHLERQHLWPAPA